MNKAPACARDTRRLRSIEIAIEMANEGSFKAVYVLVEAVRVDHDTNAFYAYCIETFFVQNQCCEFR
jgi:hypothetical protein